MQTRPFVDSMPAPAFPAAGDTLSRAEQLAQQMVDEMNRAADAAAKGTKAAIRAALARAGTLGRELNGVAVTPAQFQTIGDKYRPPLEAASTRMGEALAKAAIGGWLAMDTLREIQSELRGLGK